MWNLILLSWLGIKLVRFYILVNFGQSTMMRQETKKCDFLKLALFSSKAKIVTERTNKKDYCEVKFPENIEIVILERIEFSSSRSIYFYQFLFPFISKEKWNISMRGFSFYEILSCILNGYETWRYRNCKKVQKIFLPLFFLSR